MATIDTIVVPQGAEYQAVCRGLQKIELADLQVIAIPIGTKNTRQILANYDRQLSNSQKILIVGLCGSLSSSYIIGAKVLVQSCQDSAHNWINLDTELTATLQDKLSLDLVSGLTSDRLVSQAQEKQRLGQQYSVEIVEMEGFSYVSELQRQGKSVAMLRVVSDDLTRNIPDLDNTIDRQGKIKAGAMAIAFLKQPIAAIRLIRGSLTGLKALEQITAELST